MRWLDTEPKRGDSGKLTGQVPPDMTLSNDKASGMPLFMQLLDDATESVMDCCFASPVTESRGDEGT